MTHYKKYQRNNDNYCERAEGYAVEIEKWSLFLSLNDATPPMGATAFARKQAKMAAYITQWNTTNKVKFLPNQEDLKKTNIRSEVRSHRLFI